LSYLLLIATDYLIDYTGAFPVFSLDQIKIMTKFIAQISLQDASEKDYKSLQRELEREAFAGTKALSGKRTRNFLKEREYTKRGNITMIEVTDAVLRAASKTGKKYSFTIIKDKSS
jgi:hypothetical protein